MPGRSQGRGFRSQRRRGRGRPQGISRPSRAAPQARSASPVASPARSASPVASAARSASPVASPARAAPHPPAKETVPDYSHVYKDLRYIGIIAGGIVVVFVILFFLWK